MLYILYVIYVRLTDKELNLNLNQLRSSSREANARNSPHRWLFSRMGRSRRPAR